MTGVAVALWKSAPTLYFSVWSVRSGQILEAQDRKTGHFVPFELATLWMRGVLIHGHEALQGLGPVSLQSAVVGKGCSRAMPFSLTFGLLPTQWVFTQEIPTPELEEAGTCGDWLGIRREPRSYPSSSQGGRDPL